ncbi:MAG: CHAP domain-containing protein [Gaiellaceae bacterium]
MSIESVMARINEINTAFAPPAPPAPTPAPSQAGSSSFSSALTGAMAAAPASSAAPVGGGDAGSRMVQIAKGEIGQAEQPPGSNESARIAQYRSATQGAVAGAPWCAYFASWVANQAGAPLGDHGQGFGSVDQLYAWAQQNGRAYTAGSGQQPKPGDLIVFHEHVGLVESVLPGGQIQTIEGNSSDRVSERVHAPGDAIGFVRMS